MIARTILATLADPGVTTLPISNLPPDTIKVRRRFRINDAGRAYVKTPGQIAEYILVHGDNGDLRLYHRPERVNTTAIVHIFPDIGPDPTQIHDPTEPGMDMVGEKMMVRLQKAARTQQHGVPGQTALVWRIDLERLISEALWRRCHLPMYELTKMKADLYEKEYTDQLKEIADLHEKLEATKVALRRARSAARRSR